MPNNTVESNGRHGDQPTSILILPCDDILDVTNSSNTAKVTPCIDSLAPGKSDSSKHIFWSVFFVWSVVIVMISQIAGPMHVKPKFTYLLKSLADQLFVQQYIVSDNKNIKTVHHWPLWRESTWWTVDSPSQRDSNVESIWDTFIPEYVTGGEWHWIRQWLGVVMEQVTIDKAFLLLPWMVHSQVSLLRLMSHFFFFCIWVTGKIVSWLWCYQLMQWMTYTHWGRDKITTGVHTRYFNPLKHVGSGLF